MAERVLTLSGRPRQLDTFLRPPVRVVQLVFGVGISLFFAWKGWWLLAPLPLALSFVAYEWFFYRRADRRITLSLSPASITVDDPLRDGQTVVPVDRVHAATLLHRHLDDGEVEVEVVVQIATEQTIGLSVAFRALPGELTPEPGDVDLDRHDASLGGISGVVRAMGGRDAVVRQVVPGLEGITWLRHHLPDGAWGRTCVPVWRGAEPELDLFGYHAHPADGTLCLDGVRLVLSLAGRDPVQGAAAPVSLARTSRSVVLFRMAGEEHDEAEERIAMVVIGLGDHARIAIPAPALAIDLDEVDPSDDLLHLPGPAGAAVIAHLATHLTGADAGVLEPLTARARLAVHPTDGRAGAP